ncbi:MAG: gamma-glutamyl-gamma-aminobutyrate hydrolase family protein [Aquificaceae bacterium]|nr:gamma-glutamyl-gamma-aminobutyrate hydrolase family protein [Aquificaceae bacterium]
MKALAIRHVNIEHLGLMEKVLRDMGINFEYLDTARGQTLKEPFENYGLVVVLGGYMGAYEENLYPFLSYEFRLMEEALKRDIPLLGICLGCQMLAKVLGAKVYKGEKGKEIGWFEVFKTGEHTYFENFPKKLTVFQWHGDTFDLPTGALMVYSSEKYENQAFVYGRAVGFQFHIEVDRHMVRSWVEEYKKELLQERIAPEELITYEAKEQESLLRSFLKRFLNL